MTGKTQTASHRPTIRGRTHAISAGHHLAAQAGLEILNGGGNAVDAGVGAAITLAVVHSDIVNVAGVCPMLIHMAESGETVSIDGLGVWPAAADVEVFRREHGGVIPEGLLRTVVPAAPSAWMTALSHHGTCSFSEVAARAIEIAREGFVLYPLMADNIETDKDKYARWPSSAAHYLPNGRAPKAGDLFRQEDLGRTLQYMADEERAGSSMGRREGLERAHAAFYKGDIARTITDFHAANGGLLTAGDMAAFRARFEPVVSIPYDDLTVITCGPWCQGPVLLQALRILEGFDLKAMGHNSVEYIHTVAEALKLAFADRERFYGDPAFVDVPIDTLVSAAYATARRHLIDPDRAWIDIPPAGTGIDDPRAPHNPPKTDPKASPPVHDTSYVAVIDRHGNAFSATPSDVSRDTPIIPGTGLCPSSRGSQSRTERGHPAEIAPGKRPRLTPNPALALKDGAPHLVFGSPGADVQSQAMLECLLNVTVFGMDVQAAVEAPRFATFSFPASFAPNHHFPGRLSLESRIDDTVVNALRAKGHDVHPWPNWIWRAGAVSAVHKDDKTGLLSAGADPRRENYALGL